MTSRLSDRDARIRLEAVTPRNRSAILALELAPYQRGFVATNTESLAEAGEDDEAIPRAIVIDGHVVGFLMYSAPEDDDEAIVYRLMIDRSRQGRGLGRASIAKLLEDIASQSRVRRVLICYEPENEAARHLYASFGFMEMGLDEDGEMMAALDLKL